MLPRLMHTRANLLLLCMALAACVTGCANLGSKPAAAIPGDLRELQRWQASGRIGVAGPDNGGSGSFDWQQREDRADVQIRGPVGIGSVHLQVAGDTANPTLRLETGNGAALESQAAWDELQARLGATLPAGNLRFWMLGIAAPGEHRWLEPGAAGEKTLEQNGWRIAYQRFSDDAGAHMPVRINATSGETRVRIVIDRWRLVQ
jgi:outer membrane lipoprotein LolB